MVDRMSLSERLFATIGMEGTASRSITFNTAKKLFSIVEENPDQKFIFLIFDEIPANVDIPENCMLGVTVKMNKNINKIQMLADSRASKKLISFVLLLQLIPVEDISSVL